MSLTTFLKPLPSTRLTLRPDQEDAVSRIVDELEFGDRTQAVMACGTGKTVTAQRAAERIVEGKVDPVVLIAVPNLVLVDQMISDWRSQMVPGQEFSILPVNSRTTKRRRAEDDDFVVDIEGVTDDPETIAAFMAGAGRKLIVTTYQSMRHVADALTLIRRQAPGFELDLIIADEAHRTAGTSEADVLSPFKIVLDNDLVPAAKRVFFTATPRISKLNSKRDTDTAAASMGNPDVYGDRAITRSLRWAIGEKLLAPYRAYVVQVDDADLKSAINSNPVLRVDGDAVEARYIAAAIALVKSAAANNLGGIITYHSRIDAAQRFILTLRAVVEALPASEKPAGNLIVNHINGATPKEEREEILSTLDAANRQPGDWAVVTNCSCLTEGVNIPAMDAVMFIDPRKSVVANVQAIGRPLRRDPKNPGKIASILLPVFIGDAESPEEALQSGAFDGVYEVIKSLKDVDDALSELFINELTASHRADDLEESKASQGVDDFDNPIQLVHPTGRTTNVASWGKWHKSVRLHLLDQSTDWWEKGLAALRSFVAREGHASVPIKHKENGHALGVWVSARRAHRARLDALQQATLESLPGWWWVSTRDPWEIAFNALKTYSEREGHASPPRSHVEGGIQIGKWATTQRSYFAQGNLSAHRQERLEGLNLWLWDPLQAEWDAWFVLLSQFAAREGHTLVPTSHVEDGRPLGRWVVGVRNRKAGLGDAKIAALEAMPGWTWDRREYNFLEGLFKLREFADKHGHTTVPLNYVCDGYKLGQFVARRRSRRHELKPEYAALLEALPGWSWDRRIQAFDEGVIALKAFKERTGSALVPSSHKENGHGTGRWLTHARTKLVSGLLSREQIATLDAVDPSWRKGKKAPWEIELALPAAA